MAVALGVDVGGTKCLAVALAGGEVVVEQRAPTPAAPDAILDAVAGLARDVALAATGGAGGEDLPGVEGVGVGAPGLVDRSGVLRFAPNLPGVTELALREGLEQRLGVPVRADNDATCAAWGEARLGAAAGRRDVVLVTVGTGIGGGIVADGTVYRGANGFAGELGHMVVDPEGPRCGCGQRGCWEQFASGNALGRMAREAVAGGGAPRMLELAGGRVEALRGEHVTQAAAEGDADARTLLDRFSWWLARGLANLANVFDPEVFVVGGGLVEAHDLVLAPTRSAFAGLVLAAAHRPEVPIVPAALGPRAGAIGAACLVQDRQ